MFQFATADAAQTLMLKRNSHALKSTVANLTAEVSSGAKLDKALALGGSMARLAYVEHGLELSNRQTANAGFLSSILSAQQNALDRISIITTELAQDFQISRLAAMPSTVSEAAGRARDGFADVIGMLNTKVSGRFLFSGIAGQQTPFADPQIILDAVASGVPVGASASDMRDHVLSWFAPGGGFDTVAYLGGAPSSSETELGNGLTVHAVLSGDEQAIRESLAGLAIGALGAVLVPEPMDSHQREMLAESANVLLAADTSMVALQSRVGAREARVIDARTQAEARSAVLQITRNDLLAADPYETATALEAASQRLEALFVITSRLSRLSLTEYLR